MTHSPPIPAGNQSPYPIAEPPHRHGAALAATPKHQEQTGLGSATIIGAAVVAGIGAAAAAAAYFLSIRKAAKPQSKRRRAKRA